jgi:hypothetical protein
MPGKREPSQSQLRMETCEARVTRPRLDCLKSNPDRIDLSHRLLTSAVSHVLAQVPSGPASPHAEVPGDDPGCRDEWTA